jgi:hypothetical protein
VTSLLIACDRFFSLPASVLVTLWFAAAAAILIVTRLRGRGRTEVLAAMLIGLMTFGAFGSYKVYRRAMGTLGRHLPNVTLLEPAAGAALGNTIALKAHATDEPGALGPVGAVRSIEFWLYHPSFVEQHPGNHESKVLLAQVDGPRDGDEYAASWICSNPYTPARDGDHGGGDGTRTYKLPNDGQPYRIQAHGLDDEWRAKPGRPGFSERVAVEFTPCD